MNSLDLEGFFDIYIHPASRDEYKNSAQAKTRSLEPLLLQNTHRRAILFFFSLFSSLALWPCGFCGFCGFCGCVAFVALPCFTYLSIYLI